MNESSRLSADLICENVTRAEDGSFRFAGCSPAALAGRYGTPLYLMDEDRIRANCRTYLSAVRDFFPHGARVYYASKAASFKRIYEIMREEGMCVDVVSAGEIATAVRAGFPLANACFHSNNKTDADIAFAMDAGVGLFAADNPEELNAISAEAVRRGLRQPVILRLTPGIDPHTYEAVATGKVDSKFGFGIQTGQARAAVALALSLPGIDLRGYHCHVGSQVFDSDVYLRTADVMLTFAAEIGREFGFAAPLLDLGGGYGVRYIAGQPVIDLRANLASVAAYITRKCAELGIAVPEIGFEPGRSIVADAGMTVYTVGSVKTIPDCRTYVSVDGGMTDNIRYALYGAPYTYLPISRPNDPRTMTATVVGRCCESGDILQRDVPLPAGTRRGDLLACLTTGAYHYSMASNYNRVPRPPIVMLSGGRDYVAVRRETPDDLTRLDV